MSVPMIGHDSSWQRLLDEALVATPWRIAPAVRRSGTSFGSGGDSGEYKNSRGRFACGGVARQRAEC